MTLADESQRNVSLTPLSTSSDTQSVTFKAHAPGVGMTSEHYAWIKTQFQQEIAGTPTSSIWLAAALAFGSLFAALWIAALTTHPGNATKGKIEVVAWACLVLGGVFVLFHRVMWKGSKKRAAALIEAMDVHCFYAPVPAAVEASARASVGSGEIDVTRAVYGDPARDVALRKDVTEIVKGLVDHGKLDFTADNGTLGGDPAQDVHKMLDIQYRLVGDSTLYRRAFQEGARVLLP